MGFAALSERCIVVELSHAILGVLHRDNGSDLQTILREHGLRAIDITAIFTERHVTNDTRPICSEALADLT